MLGAFVRDLLKNSKLLSRHAPAIAFVAVMLFSASVHAKDMRKIEFATDWRAQAEQGGFYQAQAMGLYEKVGLKVTIRGGGPGVNVPQLLGAGAVELGMGSNSFIPLNMVKAGIPAKAVMAAFQRDPQVLIAHPRDDITSLADMKGKPILISDATIHTFWVWLKAQYGFKNEQIRKYTFNLAPFLVNPTAIQQGYVTSEPYTIKTRSEIEPRVFLLSDYGYPSYASMVMARQDLIDNEPKVVQAFVDASIQGWIEYVYGDPSLGNELILKANPEMKIDIIENAISVMRARGLVHSGDTLTNGVGTMTTQRWQSFYDTMADNDVFDKDLDWEKAFTTDFTSRGRAHTPTPAK